MEADKNGCVVEDGTLISYRGDRRDLIISEGIKVIPESVIVSHYLTPIRSIHLPESLKSFGISKRIIREEGNRIEVNLPEGYLNTGKITFQYLTSASDLLGRGSDIEGLCGNLSFPE